MRKAVPLLLPALNIFHDSVLDQEEKFGGSSQLLSVLAGLWPGTSKFPVVLDISSSFDLGFRLRGRSSQRCLISQQSGKKFLLHKMGEKSFFKN